MTANRKRDWSLTQGALDGLLRRLSADRDAAAQEYERVRGILLDFFDWRGSTCPDAHADETLDRVARRIAEGEWVQHVRSYVLGVARRVLLEWERHRARERAALGELPWGMGGRDPVAAERREACLERCLHELPDESRAFIVEYHQGPEARHPERRRLLAQSLGIPYGTLKTRAHRLRARLERCLERCLRSQGPE